MEEKKKGGQLGNKNAEKWTEERSIELALSLLEFISIPGNFYFKPFLESNKFTSDSFLYIITKYESARKIYQACVKIRELKNPKSASNYQNIIGYADVEYRKNSGTGYIYLVQCKGTTFYKIGTSKQRFNQRISMFQSSCPFEIVPIYLSQSNNYKSLEMNMLIKYKLFNFRGEWLDLTESKLAELLYDLKKEAID